MAGPNLQGYRRQVLQSGVRPLRAALSLARAPVALLASPLTTLLLAKAATRPKSTTRQKAATRQTAGVTVFVFRPSRSDAPSPQARPLVLPPRSSGRANSPTRVLSG